MKREHFRVEEIHCEACADAIRRSLARLEGVGSVAPHQATDSVTVAYDEARVAREAVVERLADAGFPLAERPPGRSG